jgi:hypothetical protein
MSSRSNPVYNFADRNQGWKTNVNGRRVIVISLGGLAVWLAVAGQGFAQPGPPAAGNLGEMREWLNQRNQERKKMGLPGADMVKKHFIAVQPRPRPPLRPPAVGTAYFPPPPPPEIGRGPDGRIHHRLLINEEGPDQLQVYTPSGYNTPSTEDGAKLEKLTPRGKRAWMAGSSLRDPSAYLSLKKTGHKHD